MFLRNRNVSACDDARCADGTLARKEVDAVFALAMEVTATRSKENRQGDAI